MSHASRDMDTSPGHKCESGVTVSASTKDAGQLLDERDERAGRRLNMRERRKSSASRCVKSSKVSVLRCGEASKGRSPLWMGSRIGKIGGCESERSSASTATVDLNINILSWIRGDSYARGFVEIQEDARAVCRADDIIYAVTMRSDCSEDKPGRMGDRRRYSCVD
ncbi:hypothetical protein BOTBODRAFT_253587 [Botryobasidium botryosum FD-172 SS1]|uniref:Uncharacterized protein n=1 Tax=Botryobasidium botryosum (strain FD-172 SS1) TaxID=930990 RepID=A0A067LTP3_BOTB1|nr:hypothetical protein BOTBODRAFT_253587 [Botryobasidium botryosum FD-172 SS1]